MCDDAIKSSELLWIQDEKRGKNLSLLIQLLGVADYGVSCLHAEYRLIVIKQQHHAQRNRSRCLRKSSQVNAEQALQGPEWNRDKPI